MSRWFSIACALLACLFLASSTSATWTFSQDYAFEYLYYSYAAYCNPTTLIDWSCKWCSQPQIANFTPVAFPTNSTIDAFGFVGFNSVDKTIVISFRGTEETSIENWMTDLESMTLVPYYNKAGIMVGEGFFKEWLDLKDQVFETVNQLNLSYPDYELWVTGHSLGAAVSILCAVELAEFGYESARINVYNYGLPRVGNEDFSDYYRTLVPNTFRLVNGHDIVPHLPPMSDGFYHVPTEVWENPAESLKFKICNGSGEDPNCSDKQKFDLSIYDHLHYLNIYEDCTQSYL